MPTFRGPFRRLAVLPNSIGSLLHKPYQMGAYLHSQFELESIRNKDHAVLSLKCTKVY